MNVASRRPPIGLAAFLLFVLSSCSFPQPDLSQSNLAVLPPAPTIPAIIQPTVTQLADVEREEPRGTALMPTAIARMIGQVLALPEATETATPEATATSIATPTATPCTTPGQIVTGTFPSVSAGQSAYRIFLPPCYEQKGRVYPTLYMLPGNIHSDSVWDYLGLDEAAEAAINAGDIPPLLIVMADSGPLINSTSGGPWSYESVIVDDLIPFIESNYCAWKDPMGRAIGGMSRGGYWALEIAFRHPQQFASVGGHSAALLDLYGGPDVLPQYTGLTNDLGDLRIYFDIGENDWVINNVRQLHEDMEAAGKEHVWVLNEGRHEDAYWASHSGEYLTWYSEPWPAQRSAYPHCSSDIVSPSS